MASSASETLETSPEIKTQDTQTPSSSNISDPHESKTNEDQNPEVSDQSSNTEVGEGEKIDEDEEEEGECGFCLFMKGGGCKESFIAWENCVEEGEKNKEDIVEKCAEITGLLKKCMDAHSDYYEPILRAEKAMEEEATKEIIERETEEQLEVENSKQQEK